MCGKMAEELLSLKWNNHQAHFVDILTFLREQEIFVDATLACGGKLYAAHKFVLSTCSDYFKQMFTKNPSKHPIVFMKDVTSRDLEALLDFMYNGEVNVPQSSLGSLIKTAEGLQIKGLAVPDDPPAPKRERDREKRENRTQLDHHHHHHSPPAKRPRPRERSPPHSSPSQPSPQVPPTVSRSRSPPPPVTPVGASQINMPPVEATLDEDSRTSIQSGVSGPSEQNTSTTPSLSSKQTSGSTSSQAQQHNPDDSTQHQDALGHGHTGGEEPAPGPSGLHKSQQPQQSKEEPEFEIKQEDVVELGEDDEGDWGVEGDGGGGESSLGTDNPPNFPEVMLPHSDGTMPPTGDPAMSGADALLDCRRNMKRDPDLAAAPMLGLGSQMASNILRLDTTAAAAVVGGMPYHALVDAAATSCLTTQQHTDRKSHGILTVPGRGEYKSGLNPMAGLGISVSGGGSRGGMGAMGMVDDGAERPYPCQFCEARFKKKQHLQNHERIHTGEKYVCSLCGQAFSRMHILKHHLERKHAEPAPTPLYQLDQ